MYSKEIGGSRGGIIAFIRVVNKITNSQEAALEPGSQRKYLYIIAYPLSVIGHLLSGSRGPKVSPFSRVGHNHLVLV